MHLCMGAYGDDSSRLLNFGGLKLVTNLMETKKAKSKTGKEIHGELADVYGSSAQSYA